MTKDIILQTTNQAAFEDLLDDGRKMAESSSSGSAQVNRER
jgi:hypothetical protein